MEGQKSSQDVRVRNVSLHRRGQPEHGTLYLTQHHLIFSYQPSTSGSRAVSSPQPSTSPSSSDLTAGASSNGHSQTSTGSAASSRQTVTASRRPPKEIYVPFPLIHHCRLRPSTAVSSQRPSVDAHLQQNGDDEMFPPTYGTSTYARPSTDSTRSVPYTPPRRPVSPVMAETQASARPPAIRIRCKDFAIFALHFHGPQADKSPDDAARQVFYALRDRCCVSSMEEMYAFSFKPPGEETAIGGQVYDARKEFARMGISPKASEGPGLAWRITDINNDHTYSPTYPRVLCVPQQISDNVLKYSGKFRSKARIPALAYLHPNGGSITRSSQPLVGVAGKRNPQDEKLVTAIFGSHSPKAQSPEGSPSQAAQAVETDVPAIQILDDSKTETPRQRVYGSTRRNLFVDARPRINMIANKATGGGVEDVAHYSQGIDAPVEVVFLNIDNIHVMRASLGKVVDALGNSDYLDLAPNQELLRKSDWLGHIASILDGAERVARVVGLGGSHALIHCSDGWDRTSQISALAQVMLDPHYRTLEGFITLVQKDFLSFGHKFMDRQGTAGSERWFEIENERIQPPRKDKSDNLQALGSKALSGARTWFEKSRGTIFKQPPTGPEDHSRPSTPPPNPILHTMPSPNVKEHKMSESEVSPVFHQFLDAVYQLLYQEPAAFEFNERFLRRLLYQSYSGQYGEFLFNCERERQTYLDRTPSVWANFLARRREFTNSEYAPNAADPLLFPRRQGYERELEPRWWHSLFGRKDEEMNVPKVTSMSTISSNVSTVSLHEGASEPTSTIRTAKSTPALSSVAQGGLQLSSSTDTTPSVNANASQPIVPNVAALEIEEGDPLSVSTAPAQLPSLRGGLDFAAFAQQNAFSDR
ncbi:hypothetical protein AMS68_003285 [Peltaster fructicola]|uniref:Myotubularin phosphatase domain-containing protein n=1 Tax=Peltaster fructicola TaxID=286661 RepID=A0A6H0XT23_9PEZI|nr:hypothetical protein AMS68_003285 [Peltaster fructicola]